MFDGGGIDAFCEPKSSTFTVPSSRTLMLSGFRSRNDPRVVRGFERVGDLARDGDGVRKSQASRPNDVVQRLARARTPSPAPALRGLLHAVDLRDVGMIERGQRLRLAPNRASRSDRRQLSQAGTFRATSRLSVVSRAL